MKYRASVIISGAVTEHLYGENLWSLRARGIKRLTVFEPGGGNLFPKQVEVREKVKTLRGNRALWTEPVLVVPYDSIPREQMSWVKRARARVQQMKDAGYDADRY